MKMSDITIEHGISPSTSKYEGHYFYPELPNAVRLRLYEATHFLMGVLVPELNVYMAQYTITTPPGGTFTAEAARVFARLAGEPVGEVLTPDVAILLRGELDNIVERILIQEELYYVSPLKRR